MRCRERGGATRTVAADARRLWQQHHGPAPRPGLSARAGDGAVDAARVVRQTPQQQHAAVLQRQQPATLAVAVVVPVRQRHAVGRRRAGREAIDFGPGVLPGLLTPRLVAELGLVAPRSQYAQLAQSSCVLRSAARAPRSPRSLRPACTGWCLRTWRAAIRPPCAQLAWLRSRRSGGHRRRSARAARNSPARPSLRPNRVGVP